MNDTGTKLAPPGHVWVCLACGKTSKTQFGFDEKNQNCADRGWDESCMLNSQIFQESQLLKDDLGRVISVEEIQEVAMLVKDNHEEGRFT